MDTPTPDARTVAPSAPAFVDPAELARAVGLTLAPGAFCLLGVGVVRLAHGAPPVALLPVLLGTLVAGTLVGGAVWIAARSPRGTPGRGAPMSGAHPRARSGAAARVAFRLAAAAPASIATRRPAAHRCRTARPAS